MCLWAWPFAALPATEADLGLLAESVVWQAHFEGWVERSLIAREIEAARQELPPLDPDAAYRAVLEMTEAYVRQLARIHELPAVLVPRTAVRGLSGDAIRIARLHVKGETEAALEALADPALERDAQAAHLRAQLLDERYRDAPAWRKLDVIVAYRLALSLDRERIQAARARLRIAQLYLDIGFFREAAATLRPHLDPALPRPYDIPAALTFAEAAFRVHDYRSALEALDRLPRERLTDRTLPYVLLQRAELLFKLEEYDRAAEAYEAHAAELAAREEQPDLLSSIRASFALLESDRVDDARTLLAELYQRPDPEEPAEPRPAPTPTGDTDRDTEAEETSDEPGAEPAAVEEIPVDPTRATLSLVGLLRVQTEARAGRHGEMQKLAAQVRARYPHSREAPLLATALLEAQRLLGGDRQPPPGVPELVDFETHDPAIALLSFRIETVQSDEKVKLGELDAARTTIDRLAGLARQVPAGPVQALIHDEMAYRLLQSIRRSSERRRPPDAALLDIMEKELSARQMEENGLLLAVEAFRSSGRVRTCVRWALTLREREVRPVRRGLGAWREQQCRRFADDEPPGRKALLAISDSGIAGPFSLAFAVLAAEDVIRAGDLEGAVRVYERGLESFAEPQIVGPVLLRLGELHAAARREGLARQRLERGLGATDTEATATDPLRKIGLIVLARLVERRGDPARFRDLLRRDVARTEPWWPSAYTFLGRRARLELASPEGTDPFAEGDRVLAAGRKLRDQLAEIAARAPTPSEETSP